MEPGRIAQVEHQADEVGGEQEQCDRIRHSRQRPEGPRRHHLAECRHEEEPRGQVVEQDVQGDETVPVRGLGHGQVGVPGDHGLSCGVDAHVNAP